VITKLFEEKKLTKVMIIVKCPNCGNTQKTDPRVEKQGDLTKKVKRCVYCGKSFKIHSNQTKSRILKIE